MKIKSLLLGSAAGVLAVTGAQAADLPVAPEPIDYVRVCDAFGAGYYYIPGTDTCLSVRGRVRAEYRYYDTEWDDFGTGQWRDFNSSYFRARGYIYMDSRTNTEFGLLRAYNEIWVTVSDVGSFSTLGNGGGTGVTLWNSFIQFGGFTFGRTQSFFDISGATTWAAVFTPLYSDTRQEMAAYTFAFGNGFSSSISLESNNVRRSGINGTYASGAAAGYGGTKYPDLVANLRIDQGWGSAQLSGAIHQVYAAYDPVTTPGGELGWAVGAGVDFNLPFASGASVILQGFYTKGAIAYANGDYTGVGSIAADASYNSVTGDLDLSTAWSVSGGLGFNFTPTVYAAVYGGYLDYEDGFFAGNDFKLYDVQGTLAWTPVSGLVIGTEIDYRYRDVSSTSTLNDGYGVVGLFRVQRTF